VWTLRFRGERDRGPRLPSAEAATGAPDRPASSDGQRARVAPHVTGDERSRGAPGRESRLSAEAVPWIVRAGAPRRDPPDMLGPWSSALRRSSRRSAKGVRHRILAAAADDGGPERLILDPAIARAHRHAAGARWGAQGQALGRPVRLVPTGGRGGDAPRAAALLGADRPAVAPADAARDADHVRTAPGGTGATAATPDDPALWSKLT
jgi:transposase